MKKDYQKEELTIHWNPGICIHSGNCVKHLNSVFNPQKRPWIDVDGASKQEIMDAIDKCPSGALDYSHDVSEVSIEDPQVSVTIVHNGPARVKGTVRFINRNGDEETKEGIFSICRCGKTGKKPFCDGSHKNLMPLLDEFEDE
ncbi:MAG: hypothetical protein HKN92_08230 [Chitinophagales bacterium]|nr:hypothetical protein [Chitinophagales bacterium]